MPITHVVERGDCLSSIAFRYGFFPGTIWEHADNEKLRELRGDPNVLLAGDKVVIPDKDPLTAACDTGKAHRFVRKGVPARFRMQLMNVDKPRAGLAYVLFIDDAEPIDGKTDGDGVIDVPIPPDARQGLLRLVESESEYEIQFGHLDPLNEERGIRQRLVNLGYLARRDMDDASEEQVSEALRMFQRHAGLEPSGELDDPTNDALLKEHDSKGAKG